MEALNGTGGGGYGGGEWAVEEPHNW